jgi:hypothetical protein
MVRETFRLWGLLRKGSVFCAIFLVVTLSLEVRSYLAASATRDVELVWSQPPEEDVAGYYVYYGPVSRYEDGFDDYLYAAKLLPGDYEERAPKVHYVLNGIDENLAYWVAVTAYDHDGNESLYSNEKRIATPSASVNMGGSSGGCQTAQPAVVSKHDLRSALTGWIFLALVVPGWILWLRKKATSSSVPL